MVNIRERMIIIKPAVVEMASLELLCRGDGSESLFRVRSFTQLFIWRLE